ncbi:hypothetical protein A0J61_05375 [Choanephora cucurbitarum]|uniref:Nucleoplasmin-like domain-containing protein n=1 Tax=Choanephora cucurbitarum TaxID=101091 RepID=A0A1C7NCU9_9FUNG|nr:hypothetical protein A0J61_05375 [Choanephora cucurbitarum]
MLIRGLWGQRMGPGERHAMTAPVSFRITMASLSQFKGSQRTSIFVEFQDKSLLLCSLIPEKIEQQVVDMTFLEGEPVVLRSIGSNTIDLLGNYISQGKEDDEEEDIGFQSIDELDETLAEDKEKEVVEVGEEDDDDQPYSIIHDLSLEQHIDQTPPKEKTLSVQNKTDKRKAKRANKKLQKKGINIKMKSRNIKSAPKKSNELHKKSTESPRKSTKSPKKSTESSKKSTELPKEKAHLPKSNIESTKKNAGSSKKKTDSSKKTVASPKKSDKQFKKKAELAKKDVQPSNAKIMIEKLPKDNHHDLPPVVKEASKSNIKAKGKQNPIEETVDKKQVNKEPVIQEQTSPVKETSNPKEKEVTVKLETTDKVAIDTTIIGKSSERKDEEKVIPVSTDSTQSIQSHSRYPKRRATAESVEKIKMLAKADLLALSDIRREKERKKKRNSSHQSSASKRIKLSN